MADDSCTVSEAIMTAEDVEKMGCTQVPGVQQYIMDTISTEKTYMPVMPGRNGYTRCTTRQPMTVPMGLVFILWALSS